jgi:uncharacterized protein YecT (DUF1311 family)
MKHKLLAVLLTLAATSASAQASDPCVTQRNTLEINECGKLTLAKKDKELNAAYQKLLKSLVAEDRTDTTNYAEVKKNLIEAQRNWVKFRDSDCKGQLTLNESGTIRGAVYFGCLTERTEQRTKELLKWTEG